MFDRPSSQGDHIILAQIFSPEDNEEDLSEFRELVLSAGGQIVHEFIAKQKSPSAKYFIGSGKADEILTCVQQTQADLVIFSHELTPAQERNLEKLFSCRVIDRTGLILDIFAQRARSFEGKLQVELAQLQHMVTRLVRGWTHLERQKGGIGLRGPGETQLETDRRLVKHRIDVIKKRLEKVYQQRVQGCRARKRADISTLSLVGYTNAGKSSLFNVLTQADVYVADQLFATLDPTLRQISLKSFGKIIIADTVGFIRHLPHALVASFRATLEETRNADLLLHVIDAADSESKEKIVQVEEVLEEVGAKEVAILEVFNKIDLLEQIEPRIDYDEFGQPARVWVSAKTGAGLDLLRDAIALRLCQTFVICSLRLQPGEGRLRARLYEVEAVTKEYLHADGNVILELRLPENVYKKELMIT
jgi:GTP-binding protein HflX